MKRSTLKALGLALLIPGLLLGALPVVALYTTVLSGVSEFEWVINGFNIAALEHHGPVSEAVVTPLAWAAAASGELILIWMHLTRPQMANRFDIASR